MTYPQPVARLIRELGRLPGIGPKSAQRIAFYLLVQPREDVHALAEAIWQGRVQIGYCSVCGNLSSRQEDPCKICADENRQRDQITVVEHPRDVQALERMGGLRGLYHVLHGVISPIDGVGPDDLTIKQLLARVHQEEPVEIVLATNPTVEGEATALYLAKLLKPLGVRVTRIARGLPEGGDLEYADAVTLARAFEGRREI